MWYVLDKIYFFIDLNEYLMIFNCWGKNNFLCIIFFIMSIYVILFSV